MNVSSSCSCRLGVIMRALGAPSRPRPNKRQWQFVGAALLFFFAYFFYVTITRNVGEHGMFLLGVFSFFGFATFIAGILSVIVGLVGCDDCVSRM